MCVSTHSCIYLELLEHWGQRWISSEALLLLHQTHVLIYSGAVLPHPDNMHACQWETTHKVFLTACYQQQYLLCAGGSRNRSARRQRALLSPSQVRQRVFNVGVFAPFNLTFLKRRKAQNSSREEQKKKPKWKIERLFTHLLLLYASLQSFYIVLHGHIDESVLSLGLHHPRALRTNHLDGFWHVDVTVHPCSHANNISHWLLHSQHWWQQFK